LKARLVTWGIVRGIATDRTRMAKSGKGSAQLKFGRYNALTKLGQGAMATVYLAEDPSLNRMVAIKVIHSHLSTNTSLLDRFTVEAKTAAGLRNPNIVEIFDYGVEDDLQYLVMEYIDGPNLQFVLNLLGGQPMEPEVVAAVIFQAAEGLSTADRFNVVHRDIKPENMMFMSDGKLKIADFGIAHISEQNLTQTGSILGSPNFMSPEQIDGRKPSHQTDMFSLGAVFYYCLSGRKPFTGPNIPTIMRNISDMPQASLATIIPDVDPFLENLVDTLLQKKPEDRGNGARWLSLQLRSYLNQRGILDPSDATKGYLEKVGKMGNQTVIDLTPAPGPDETAPRGGKAPLKPGMKVERPKSGTGVKPGTGIRPGTGVRPGTGIRPGTGVRPGTWQAGPPDGGDMDFSGSRPRGGKGKTIGLWVGTGIVAAALLATALIVVLTTGSDKPAPQPVAVSNDVASVSLQPASMELQAGQKRKFILAVLPANAPAGVIWESADPSIAAVQDGEVWGQKPGQTTIKAISTQDQTKVGSADVIVSGATVVASEPTPTHTDHVVHAGTSHTNTNTNSNANANNNPTPGGSDNGDDGEPPRTVEKPPATKAILTVTSAPPFAEVIVDGRFIGTTPVKDKELPVGKHKVQITHRSFPEIDTVVVLGVGEKTLRFRLFR
jgi:hypothetical protein